MNIFNNIRTHYTANKLDYLSKRENIIEFIIYFYTFAKKIFISVTSYEAYF